MGTGTATRDERPNPSRREFFERMLAEYRTLGESSGNGAARVVADEIATRFENDPASLTVRDVNTFEVAVMRLQPNASLLRVARRLRNEYREIAGPEAFRGFEAANPCPKEGEHQKLRGEIDQLVNEIQRLRSIIPIRENLRNSRAWQVGLLTLLCFFFAVGFLVYSLVAASHEEGPSQLDPLLTFVLATAAGAIGGCVSALQRLYDVPVEHASFLRLRHGWFSVILAPVYGMVFSALLYLMFMSGLVKGAMFPEFKTYTSVQTRSHERSKETAAPDQPGSDRAEQRKAATPEREPDGTPMPVAAPEGAEKTAGERAGAEEGGGKGRGVGGRPDDRATPSRTGSNPAEVDYTLHYLGVTEPASVAAFAMLLVWCFIAGFLERFVPDTITNTLTRARSGNEGAAAAAGAGAGAAAAGGERGGNGGESDDGGGSDGRGAQPAKDAAQPGASAGTGTGADAGSATGAGVGSQPDAGPGG